MKESDSSQPFAVARFAQASCKELLVPRLWDSVVSTNAVNLVYAIFQIMGEKFKSLFELIF